MRTAAVTSWSTHCKAVCVCVCAHKEDEWAEERGCLFKGCTAGSMTRAWRLWERLMGRLFYTFIMLIRRTQCHLVLGKQWVKLSRDGCASEILSFKQLQEEQGEDLCRSVCGG